MIAVVTGGCSGLGLRFTKYLLAHGYKVYALYNSSIDNALELERDFLDVRCIKCDIKDEAKVDEVLFQIGDVDLLINNAAICIDNNFHDKTKKEFMSVLETNLVGNFIMTKYSIPKLNKKGIIVNISSNNALTNYNPLSMDYDASKAGVNILTKDFSIVLDSLKKEQKIVSICPGWINTEVIRECDPKYIESEMKRSNQSKLIEPEKLVEYIMNNINNYSNGEIIEIKEV